MDQTNSTRGVVLKFSCAAILVYAAIGFFSGLPPGANLGAFFAGLIVLFAGIAVLVALTWYALVSPLPNNLSPSKKRPLSHGMRQGIALFLVLMSALGVAAGLWDVTWHVRSGLPFGEDFFWAPHQFIYVALIAPIIVAMFLWYKVFSKSNGTMRQRLRADVPVTMIIMGGIAMLFTLPADPLWHVIYGEDLTGLSVPHIVFSISSTFTMIGTLSILLSYTPLRATWASILKINRMEALIVFSLAITFMSLLMPTLGDWEAITLSTSALPRLPALVEARPDWAMPFLAVFVSVFPASIALRITRRPGTAALLWLITSVIRSVLFLIFGYAETGMATMFLTLPFMVALDLAAWVQASRNKPLTSLVSAGAATAAGVVAVLPQIPLFFTDPVLSAGNLPAIIVSLFVGALCAAYMGIVLGDVIFKTVRFALPADAPVIARPVVRTLSALALTLFVVAAIFVATSSMPSA